MSFNYERAGYGAFRRGAFHNGPRINENQVPQSKHTIFIRGLGGEVSTAEIEEYIGERVGKIKFDFVKHTQDRSKIFVAVRFEKREEAKEFMDTYTDRDFMGYRCELSWFRDIRRYCAYQRSKQVRSNSQRRRRRSDSDDSRQASESPERRSKSRESRGSRSGSRNSRQSRSRSRSSDRAPRDLSRSRSRGSNRSKSSRRSRSRSNSNERRARSTSRSSRRVDSRNGNDSSRERSDTEEEKRRIRERQARAKKRRQLSGSENDILSDDDKATKKKNKEELPTIPLPPVGVQKSPPKPKTDAFIPPPTVDMEVESPKSPAPQHVNPYQMHQSYKPQEPAPQVQSTTYVVPIKEEAPPKPIVRETAPQSAQNPSYPIPTHTASYNAQPAAPIHQYQQPYPQVQNYVQPAAPVAPVVAAPPAPPAQAPPQPQAPPPQPAFVPRQVGKIEILMPAALPAPPPAPVPAPGPSRKANGASKRVDTTLLTASHQLFGHLKAFQSALLSTVKYEPPAKSDDDGLSTLRLSSLASDEDEDTKEDMKILEREEKLKSLSDEQRIRFHIKKKQFETAFRGDCETYAVVTRALLAKDESMQFNLKIALMENMEDLHKKMMERVDALIDQLIG